MGKEIDKDAVLADAIRKMWDDLKYACEDAGDTGTAASNAEMYIANFSHAVCSGIDAPYGYTHTLHYRLWQDVVLVRSENSDTYTEPLIRLELILTEVATDKAQVFKFHAPLGGFPLYV